MSTHYVIVDCEASGSTPFSGVLTEFGAVDLASDRCFYARLWPSAPDPEHPAVSVVSPGSQPEVMVSFDTADGLVKRRLTEIRSAFATMQEWLHSLGAESDRSVFVSDNPAYDFLWIADGFDRSGLVNPFGWSGRRIGDLAAGLSGNWRNTQGWKKYRRTVHDHNPLNDARGNAEALRFLLDNYGQQL